MIEIYNLYYNKRLCFKINLKNISFFDFIKCELNIYFKFIIFFILKINFLKIKKLYF